MPASSTRSLPQATAESEAHWAGARAGRLMIQRCGACGRHQFPPRGFCTACLADAPAWVQASGCGRIYSFTICRIAAVPDLDAELPYAVALVDLEEGVRMLARLEGAPPEHVAIGARVELRFEALEGGVALPRFKLTP